jgi:hypothetical protein
MSAQTIVEKLLAGGKAHGRPDSDFSAQQIAKGEKVELEHTTSRPLAHAIAKDHLAEIPDYYTRLKKMEAGAEKRADVPRRLKEYVGRDEKGRPFMQLEPGVWATGRNKGLQTPGDAVLNYPYAKAKIRKKFEGAALGRDIASTRSFAKKHPRLAPLARLVEGAEKVTQPTAVREWAARDLGHAATPTKEFALKQMKNLSDAGIRGLKGILKRKLGTAAEIPDYYTRLKKMEVDAEKEAGAPAIPEGGLRPGLLMNDLTQTMGPEDSALVKSKIPWYKRSGPGLLPTAVLGAISGSTAPELLAAVRQRTLSPHVSGRSRLVGGLVGGLGMPALVYGLTRSGVYDKGALEASQRAIEKAKGKTSMNKQAGDMPHFLDQDRPAKVKEIYGALKRDHPDMPAEMKARIAARKGKKSPESRKPPETGGPEYKAPITPWHEKQAFINLGTLSGAMEAGEGRRFGGAVAGSGGGLLGGALGGGAGVVGGGLLGAGIGALTRSPQAAHLGAIGGGVGGSLYGQWKGGRMAAKHFFPKGVRVASQHEKQASLNLALGQLWNKGPGQFSKHAAAGYFTYRINKNERDQGALGRSFCKLAHHIHKEPWDLAKEVVRSYRGMEYLAKTASNPDQRELAQFYIAWADGIIKKAGIWDTMVRGTRAAGAGAKALGQKLVPESVKATRAIEAAGTAGAKMPGASKGVGEAMRQSWGQTGALQQMGGGSLARGEGIRNVMREESAAKMLARKPAPTAVPGGGAGAVSAAEPKPSLKDYAWGVGVPALAGAGLGYGVGSSNS